MLLFPFVAAEFVPFPSVPEEKEEYLVFSLLCIDQNTEMDDQKLLGRDRRNRSPDADQEYFIDKMRMLKTRLRKFEDVSGFPIILPLLC